MHAVIINTVALSGLFFSLSKPVINMMKAAKKDIKKKPSRNTNKMGEDKPSIIVNYFTYT
jgi:hypothetical protein